MAADPAGLAPIQLDDDPDRVPSAVGDINTPFSRSDDQPEALPSGPRQPDSPTPADDTVWPPELKESLQSTNPFFRDTTLKLYMRSFYFDGEENGDIPQKAWAAGGALWYQSGYLNDRFQVGAAVATSQPLYAPAGEGGTGVLTNDQGEITTPLLAYGRVRGLGQEVTIGRQALHLPYVNMQDNRMIPITFEGVTVTRSGVSDTAPNYISGYLWRYKTQSSRTFDPMSEGLGVAEDRGMALNGVLITPRDGLTMGVLNYYVPDTLTTTYGEVDWLFPEMQTGLQYRTSVNYTDQRSVGADLIPGGPYDTNQVSFRAAASLNGFTLTAAASFNGDGAPIQSPYGSFTVYTDFDQSDWERAGEQAWAIFAAYDFSKRVPGLKMQVSYGQGREAIDPLNGAPLPDIDEIDFNIDYQPQSGPLQNLRFQLLYSVEDILLDGPADAEAPQLRTVVTYVVPLL
ncbi:OprD family outer membrane porin [Methyloligella solikamskensis]|uniref:OprD family outer membrane porin n=1 Tax=Methyloligella solikamskensis TaxID=1177756 RepID=A0ABW3JA52_9HYPH